MSKKFLIFIVLFCSISINNIASSEILPLKKPRQTKEETQKKLLIDVLRPLPKPTKKVEIKALVGKTKQTRVIFKRRKVASTTSLIGRSVGLSVGLSACPQHALELVLEA